MEEAGIDMRWGFKTALPPRVFDSPYRSDHCRIITNVFRCHLPTFRKPKAGDDASRAQWIKTSQLHQYEFYQDHFHIIKEMLNEHKSSPLN